jgi:hypothetical protein
MNIISYKPIFLKVRHYNRPNLKKHTVKKSDKLESKQIISRQFLAERINGRLAMFGYCIGNGYKYYTGISYIEQMQINLPIVCILSSIIAYLSFKDEILKKGFWNEFETFNGRVAMLDFVIETMLYMDESIFLTIE